MYKKCIIIVFILLNLTSSSLFASKSFISNYINPHLCSSYEIEDHHEHYHSHHGYSHKHKHGHTQSHINFFDLSTDINTRELYITSNFRQIYLENTPWIPNYIQKSLFRPPKA